MLDATRNVGLRTVTGGLLWHEGLLALQFSKNEGRKTLSRSNESPWVIWYAEAKTNLIVHQQLNQKNKHLTLSFPLSIDLIACAWVVITWVVKIALSPPSRPILSPHYHPPYPPSHPITSTHSSNTTKSCCTWEETTLLMCATLLPLKSRLVGWQSTGLPAIFNKKKVATCYQEPKSTKI